MSFVDNKTNLYKRRTNKNIRIIIPKITITIEDIQQFHKRRLQFISYINLNNFDLYKRIIKHINRHKR